MAITLEAIIFAFHAREIAYIDSLYIDVQDIENIVKDTPFANARSLLVYFILFMLAQVFTVILVIDAVSILIYLTTHLHTHNQ